MAPEYKAPGVYIEETSTNVRTIAGVPTSTEQKLAADTEQKLAADTKQRVASQDTEYKYVSVRRLFVFLEDSIDKGLNWLLYEPKEREKRKKKKE